MGKNGDIVKSIYAAFGAESAVYADRNPYAGPQAVAVAEGVFQRIVSDVDGFTLTPEHFIDGGDTIVVEGRYQGTTKSTGTRFDAHFAHVWRLRNGKVIRFQQYTDAQKMG